MTMQMTTFKHTKTTCVACAQDSRAMMNNEITSVEQLHMTTCIR